MQPRIVAALSLHHLLQGQHAPLRHLTKCYKKPTREGEERVYVALLHERLEEELENVAADMASEANWMCDWMFGGRVTDEEFKSSQ
jgi:hypothetical protein